MIQNMREHGREASAFPYRTFMIVILRVAFSAFAIPPF